MESGISILIKRPDATLQLATAGEERDQFIIIIKECFYKKPGSIIFQLYRYIGDLHLFLMKANCIL